MTLHSPQSKLRFLLLRLLLVLALSTALAALFTSTGFADTGDGTDNGAEPVDQLCVVGTVIDHEEKPIGGWTITAIKYTDDGSTLDPATTISVETDNQGRFRFDNLTPGLWNFSIEPQEGWEPVTAATFNVPVEYGKAGCQTIRFKMRRLVQVDVLKIDADHTPLANWVIHAHPGHGNYFALPKDATTNAEGIATFYLTPGQWVFTESPPAGTAYAPVSPPDGVQELDVAAPGPYLIRFKNRLFPGQGCIEVYKTDIPPAGSNQNPFGLADWYVQVERTDGTIAASGRTNAQGRVVFSNLPLGPYVVREEVQSGWQAATPTAFKVTLTGPECKVIEFQNKQVEPGFCIVGRKVDANGHVGLPGWEIDATPAASGGYDPAPVTTDGLGYFKIEFPLNDYRIPGAKYQVCEKVPSGWLPHTDTCQTVQLPYQPGACVPLHYDFENQQVGHSESKVYKKPYPTGCAHTYTVKKGDQLYAIGRSHGRTPQQMLNANPEVRSRKHMYLYTGEQVCIP